ncbi:hypothetical protein AKA01nite_18460 [Alkalibacterium kapii]|uniref:Transposase IS4-like domain-containing protein n=2 Tax=Alkalibacterium kapii TaxID=426704 RepID=A0A511AVQ7_9LACT|nr:hypothetical protein AKA01nite_18460 [Alkalibacterium kapii]
MNSMEIYQTKRHLNTFIDKLTKGLSKPRQKFFRDLVYGISKANSVILSDIGRSLEEECDIQYIIKRLSRQLTKGADSSILHQNYLNSIKKAIPDNALILVDQSDIIKPYAEKMEALSPVFDGSTKKIEKGYHTINFSTATIQTKHPIPLYSHVCSSKEEQFQSLNVEEIKGFQMIHEVMGEKPCTFVMDRGYDSNVMYEAIDKLDRQFVTRLKDNRYLIHKNKRVKVPTLANKRKGKINFCTEIKGKTYHLKVSHVKVKLPILKETPLNMIVVYGYGQKPMKLLTNHEIKGKHDVLRILKAYITRWRIEELFRVQKQEFHLEAMRTMSLMSLRTLYRIVNYVIGYYSLLIEKNTGLTQIILARSQSSNPLSKIKFYLYRMIRGVRAILSSDKKGINHFHFVKRRTSQLTLW